jgi:hypothetical protein
MLAKSVLIGQFAARRLMGVIPRKKLREKPEPLDSTHLRQTGLA